MTRTKTPIVAQTISPLLRPANLSRRGFLRGIGVTGLSVSLGGLVIPKAISLSSSTSPSPLLLSSPLFFYIARWTEADGNDYLQGTMGDESLVVHLPKTAIRATVQRSGFKDATEGVYVAGGNMLSSITIDDLRVLSQGACVKF